MTEKADMVHGGIPHQRKLQIKLVQDELARKGWNQADLGRAANLPRYTVSRLLRGIVPMSRDHAHRISAALELDPNALLQAANPSASLDFLAGVQSLVQPDGLVRVRANVLVQPGVHLALEAIAAYDQPLRVDRLAHILNALYEPLPGRSSD